MAKEILLFKCPNCNTWGHFQDDSECECGAHVFENGDPYNINQNTETLRVNINNLIKATTALIESANDVMWLHDNGKGCMCKSCARNLAKKTLNISY